MTTEAAAREILPAELVAEHAAGGIPLSALLSPMNLFVSLGLLVIAAIVCLALAPDEGGELRGPRDLGIEFKDDEDSSGDEAAGGIVLGVGLGLALLAGFVVYLARDEAGLGRLGLNQINAAMLGLGLVLRLAHPLPEGGRGGGPRSRGHHRPVPALRRRDGHDGGERTARDVRRRGQPSQRRTLPLFTMASAGVSASSFPRAAGSGPCRGRSRWKPVRSTASPSAR